MSEKLKLLRSPTIKRKKLVFAQVKKEHNKFWRLVTIWVDGGYRGEEFLKWVMDKYRWILETILRSDQQKGFKILPRRWVVERTFGWFNWCRRLNKDYEVLPATRIIVVELDLFLKPYLVNLYCYFTPIYLKRSLKLYLIHGYSGQPLFNILI